MYMFRIMRMAVAAATLLLISATAVAEIPQGYYNDLNGKTQSALKTAACKIINPHTPVSSYNNLPQYFQKTDVYPAGDPKYGLWWDMYSNIPVRVPNFSGLMNREHAFPKSWWGGSESTPAYTDLNHLYPSEAKANQAKSNYPLGMVANASKFNNGVTKVGTAVSGQGGGAQFVFEPDDQYKGDFARTYFYMVTCYQDMSWKYKYMLMDGTYPTLNQWSVDLLLQWHREDPVSQKELDRNEAVYRIQNNRNPFIDFPDLAEYIWGKKMGEPFKVEIPDIPPTEASLITPVQDMYLDFGQVAIGSSVTRSLPVRGQNTTGQVNVSIVRNYRDVFSVEGAGFTNISSALVNSTNGTNVSVTYTPVELGEKTGSLSISGGGLSTVVNIILHGECLPVPQLSTLKALDPSDLTPDSYTANWEAPSSDETVDYYMVTRTRYMPGGTQETEELPAEDTSIEITGFNESESESYYVQSVRLGHRSEPSNVVFVAHSGITGIANVAPLTVEQRPGGITLRCGEPMTGIRVIDMTGRDVTVIASADTELSIDLPRGIYLITTDRHQRPVKAAVQ